MKICFGLKVMPQAPPGSAFSGVYAYIFLYEENLCSFE